MMYHLYEIYNVEDATEHYQVTREVIHTENCKKGQ